MVANYLKILYLMLFNICWVEKSCSELDAKQAMFTCKALGFRLKSSFIREDSTRSVLECAHLCLKTIICKSFSYQSISNTIRHRCRLNNATTSETTPLIPNENYEYYEMLEFPSQDDSHPQTGNNGAVIIEENNGGTSNTRGYFYILGHGTLYVDGKDYGSQDNANASSVTIPRDYQKIKISAIALQPGNPGIIMSLDSGVVTDEAWQCQQIGTASWKQAVSHGLRDVATIKPKQEIIAKNAHWIWTGNLENADVECRKVSK